MSELFESLKTGLEQAISYEKGEKSAGRSQMVSVTPFPKYKKEDVKSIRKKLGLTQHVFASVMGVSSKTVEAWESGQNAPSGSSSRMLQLLDAGGKRILQEYKILPIAKAMLF